MLTRLLSEEQLLSQVADWRASGQKVGFTCGAFDLLHAGHVDYLQKARVLCDRLIVAVNSDESVRSYKEPMRPIIGEKHRVSLIASLSCVDATTIMHDSRPSRLIQVLQPDLYIKGGDYRTEQLRSALIVESYGGRCIVIPMQHEISTSAIVERIQQGSLYASAEEAESSAASRMVLLDRDGTLIENVPFLNDPSRVKLLDGVGEGLQLLQNHGFRLVVVTNQQGMGLGYFDYNAFVAVNSEMLRQLSPFGVRISKFYFCPHSAADLCSCRKPGTKLIERALADFHCNAEECYFIGDSTSDLLAARSAGCEGLLVGTSGLRGHRSSGVSFIEAANEIVSKSAAVMTQLP